ncbi:MAG: hypothetical protein Q4F43_10400, partial [Eubacteriales bacterium]|nr:hypothetical protein [Eubacteriales bacterium]
MRKILLAIVIAVIAVLGAGCSPRGSGGEGGGTGKPGAGSAQSLQEFCGDGELNAWFDSITENPPVKMTYIIYGEGPISMEFTDPELIVRTAQALQTVRIGEKSSENPDNVMDAGGDGYFFEMADGKRFSFSFVLGCFRWKKGEYHDVYSYGSLPEVSEELLRIGNPQFIYAYAEDDGFYIKHLETYRSGWKAEDGYGGGLFVYLGEEDKAPYVSVCRCLRQSGKGQTGTDENMSAMEFLTMELSEQVTGEIESSGAVVADLSGAQEYTFDRKTVPGMVYTVLPQGEKAGDEAAEGTTALPAGEEAEASAKEGSQAEMKMMVLVLKEEDDLLRKPAFIRFTAAYHASVPDEEAKVMAALKAALR